MFLESFSSYLRLNSLSLTVGNLSLADDSSDIFRVCLWVGRKKNEMLNSISLLFEQQKTEFDRIAKIRFFPIYFYTLWRWYTFLHTCQDIFLSWKASFRIFMHNKISQGGDIASTRNLYQICMLNYSHVIKLFISCTTGQYRYSTSYITFNQ